MFDTRSWNDTVGITDALVAVSVPSAYVLSLLLFYRWVQPTSSVPFDLPPYAVVGAFVLGFGIGWWNDRKRRRLAGAVLALVGALTGLYGINPGIVCPIDAGSGCTTVVEPILPVLVAGFVTMVVGILIDVGEI